MAKKNKYLHMGPGGYVYNSTDPDYIPPAYQTGVPGVTPKALPPIVSNTPVVAPKVTSTNTSSKGGDMSDEDKADMINMGTGLVTDTIGLIGNPDPDHKSGNLGKTIGSGVGAAAGFAVAGPLGAKVGSAILGTAGALIGGASDKKRAADKESRKQQLNYSGLNLGINLNSYGDQYGDGGMPGYGPESQPSNVSQGTVKMVNVERGEILIDPGKEDMPIMRKFTNNNRYSAHKDKSFDEPMGNFVNIPEGMIVIPKRLAPRYEKGDKLTRRSILLGILSKQATDPEHNVPDDQKSDVPQAGDGMYVDPILDSSKLKLNPYLWGNPPLKKTPIGSFTPDKNAPEITPEGYTGPGTVSTTIPNSSVFPNQNEPVQNMNGPIDQSVFKPTSSEGTGTRSKKNIGMLARKAIQNLPVFAQMAESLQGDPFLGHNENTQYTNAMGIAGQMPESVSVADNLAANDRSFATSLQGINDNNTPSSRAEASQMLATKIAGDNSVYGQRNNVNGQLKSSKLATLLGLTVQHGADMQQDRGRVMNEQRMDQATRENNFNEGLVNLSNNELGSQNDSMRIKAINSVMHSIAVDPYAQELIKQNPEFGQYALNYMLDGQGDVNDAYIAFSNQKRGETTRYNMTTTDAKGKTSTRSGVRIKKPN